MSVFKTQSLLTITARTRYNDIASGDDHKILYKKPDGTTGEWTATVSGTNLIYNTSDGDIDQAGDWEFQAYFEVGGLKAFGSIHTQRFEQPLI